jgi:hypothetical protein
MGAVDDSSWRADHFGWINIRNCLCCHEYTGESALGCRRCWFGDHCGRITAFARPIQVQCELNTIKA